MIIYPKISLSKLILCLSQVLDHVHPTVIDHQLRTAYISIKIAKKMGLSKSKLLDLMLAGALTCPIFLYQLS
jgi:HD-GYP domain-containing protein (c-di-GMP phosphodiesterase class II)